MKAYKSMNSVRFGAGTYLRVAGLCLAAAAGCAESSPPPFRLDMTKMVARQISPENQQAIANILGAMFGTPDEPFALSETGLDQRKLTMAAGPVWGNRPGVKRGLYRNHCAHCHGISGDGQGPTASILNPYPRDYRSGVFKFKSTYTASEPTTDDLRAVVHNGIPGTAMPSFALLPPDEVNALVEYVKYLSMRGQMETALANFVADELDEGETLDPENDPELREIIVGDLLGEVVTVWSDATEQIIVPAADTLPADNRSPEELSASVDAGRELFYGTRANCIQCHGPTGLGDGQQTDYDNWSKANREFIDGTTALVDQIKSQNQSLAELTGEERDAAADELARMQRELTERQALIAHMLPPRNAIPRNLRDNIYRGGRRPLDLFWRISAGIAGTPMPAAGPASPGAQSTLTEQEIWQIVDYVQSLPFEPASRPRTRPVNVEAVN
jgi:mono/diheme cytochrome c family protein